MSLQISEIDVANLRPNPWNTNVVSPENEEKIKNSLTRFGFFRPIVARTLEDGTIQILGGEHRWSVAKSMGYKTVPVINLGDIPEVKAKELSLVDNGRYGEDDALQLSELLRELGGADDILSFLPYTGDELENMFSASSIALDELDIPEDDGTLPEIATGKTAQTHTIMRFKVPIDDSERVQRIIENTMKAQGYTGDDSMMNAGNALVYLMKGL